MTALRSPEDILTVELKEIHSAERQLSRVLPKLSKKASSERLRDLLGQRLDQGERLIEEVEHALEEMEAPKARQRNLAAEGLIEDINEHLEEVEEDSLLDPLLLASIQKIEHYCLAAWGTAAAMGRLLEQENLVKAMEHALDEGKKLDEEMTKLAEEEINPQMLEGTEEEEEEGEEEESEEGEESDEESEDDDAEDGTHRSSRSSSGRGKRAKSR